MNHGKTTYSNGRGNRKGSQMNVDVFWLFFSAVLTTGLTTAIVILILRRKYLPVIRQLENESQSRAQPEQHGSGREGE